PVSPALPTSVPDVMSDVVPDALPVAAQAPAPSEAMAQREAAVSRPEMDIQLQVKRQLEQELASLREQLQKELDEARLAAERNGFAAGLEKGEEAASTAVAEQVARLASVSTSLYQARAGVIDSAEEMLVEIAYTAVCRIIGEAAVERNAIASMLQKVVAESRERDQLVVRLHPQDVDLVRQATDQPAAAALLQSGSLRADSSIRLGGCMVDSNSGYLDARLEVQLKNLGESLLAVRKSREKTEEQL
ncbi:MAG TPA: FliH/SctL family protein, partial [Noviherbaspirillum sp.]|nr:FliH/SctL family protein [Noviherbaspirillum sp.]